jgi:hypothetical protein
MLDFMKTDIIKHFLAIFTKEYKFVDIYWQAQKNLRGINAEKLDRFVCINPPNPKNIFDRNNIIEYSSKLKIPLIGIHFMPANYDIKYANIMNYDYFMISIKI